MKILLYNVGYCAGMTGAKSQYFFDFPRFFHTPKQIYQSIERTIGSLVTKEKPDVCCFLEVHKDFDVGDIENRYHCRVINNKYGIHSLLRKLPFFRSNCNAFFARKRLPFHRHFLHEGTKRLLYDIRLKNGLTLIVSHFSLSKRVRRKQFEEIRRMIRKNMRVIVCGDFNIMSGEKELRHLVESCNLRIVHPRGDTFPTVHPTKHFDLFLCSKNVAVKGWKILKNYKISDHLPVMLEI